MGILDDDSLLCHQTLRAKNVMGDVIFEGAGDYSVDDFGCNCCLEWGFGCCRPNSNEVTFTHRGKTIGQLKRSNRNQDDNELILFDSVDMDLRTKAMLIYASYSAVSFCFIIFLVTLTPISLASSF